jgi:outer membrane receptor protein involved in Fe transport
MTVRACLFSSAALGCALATAFIPTIGHAQGAPDTAEAANDIVVTGSRVRSPAATASGPLVAVDSDAIAFQGTPTADGLLNALPQVSGSNTSGQSTFGTPGIATVNLRKLGPSRTLVLIDGRRLMPGDPMLPVADLNFIPTSLVSSVETVTGGASTAYGSDAVAGVVNFKLRRDLEGLRLDYQVSAYQTQNDNKGAQDKLRAFGVEVPEAGWDGWTHDVSLAGGHNFGGGRGNVTTYFAYRNAQPVGAIDRDFAACGIGTVSGAQPFDTHVCTGSGTNAYGRFRTGGTGGGLAANPNGSASFVPYTGALAYNSAKENYLQRQDERYSAGLLAHYEVSDAVELYTDVMFMQDTTRAQIAPAGIVGNRTYTINCDNPLLGASQATALCGANAGSATAVWSGTIAKRLEVAGRQRYYDVRHRQWRGVVGARGEFAQGWSYDVYGQYGRVEYANDATNDVSVARVQDALLARNVGGTVQCISGNRGCAPLNIFQLGQVSPEAADYVFASGRTTGRVTQKVAAATINGDLGTIGLATPFAANPVAVAFGVEYREDAISLSPSANLLSGDLAGFGATAPAVGSTHVTEGFLELVAPLVSDRPFFDRLTLNAGYRHSEYNLAGGADTFKAGLEWAPIPDVVLRGGFNRAIRAPNVVELFAPPSFSSASITDVCAGRNPTGTLAQCANTGVTSTQYGSIAECASNFCTTLTGGNLALRPETADTWTMGLVLNPRFARSLVLTVDYYDIKVRNLIGTVSPTLAYSQCLNNADAFFCNLIQRDANGSLATTGGYIAATNINTGYLKASGIDVTLAYATDIGSLGRLLLDTNGSWTRNRKVSPLPGQPAYDCAGLYGPTCGSPTPKWRHTARLTWQTPGKLAVSLAWRFVGASQVDINDGNSVFSGATGGRRDIADARIGAVSYFDLSGSVPVADGDFVLRFGVRNIADRDPPIVDNFNLGVNADYGNGNTFPALYDTLGRTVFLGLTAKL